MNTELHHAIEIAQQALQRIASLTRHHDACQNIHGCPDNKQHDKGREHRCYACWRYKRTHGHDRTHRYARTNTNTNETNPTHD